MTKYNPEKDIPNLSGKAILVTGGQDNRVTPRPLLTQVIGTAGLGSETVSLLAAHSPAHIFFTGRSSGRADRLISEVKAEYPSILITFIEMDLASLSSIQAGSKEILFKIQRLDILVCNAGVMALPPGLTKDGYEIQFGTNHLGHALLIKLLFPTLVETTKQPGADVRVVLLSSEAYQGHPMGAIIFKDLKITQGSFLAFGAWQRYGQSKLANILYAAELARKYPDSRVLFVSLHPGVFNTGLVKNLSVLNRAMVWGGNFGKVKDEKKEGEGAWNTCWCATHKREDMLNGEFYYPVGERGGLGRGKTPMRSLLGSFGIGRKRSWITGAKSSPRAVEFAQEAADCRMKRISSNAGSIRLFEVCVTCRFSRVSSTT